MNYSQAEFLCPCAYLQLLEKVMKKFINFIKTSQILSLSNDLNVAPHSWLTLNHSWLTYILHSGSFKPSHSSQAYHCSHSLSIMLHLTRLRQSKMLHVGSSGFLFLHLRVFMPHHSGPLPSVTYFE